MTRAQWTETAVEDLDGLRHYLSDFSEQKAAEQVEQLLEAARWLAERPRAGPALGLYGWRKWRPRGADYLLIYEVADDGVIILRVRHVRNNWRSDAS